MTLDGYCELEGDEEWCEIHQCKRPCEHCRGDEIDRRFEERREKIANHWRMK